LAPSSQPASLSDSSPDPQPARLEAAYDAGVPTVVPQSHDTIRVWLAMGSIIAVLAIVVTACATYLIAVILNHALAETRELLLTVLGFVGGSLTTAVVAFYFDRRR
jgi:hypothetical protein